MTRLIYHICPENARGCGKIAARLAATTTVAAAPWAIRKTLKYHSSPRGCRYPAPVAVGCQPTGREIKPTHPIGTVRPGAIFHIVPLGRHFFSSRERVSVCCRAGRVTVHCALRTMHSLLAAEQLVEIDAEQLCRFGREGEGLIPFLYKFTKKLWLSLDRFIANKKNVRIVKKY